jgi:hypothetical protein
MWTSENAAYRTFVNKGMKEGRDCSRSPGPRAKEMPFSLGTDGYLRAERLHLQRTRLRPRRLRWRHLLQRLRRRLPSRLLPLRNLSANISSPPFPKGGRGCGVPPVS